VGVGCGCRPRSALKVAAPMGARGDESSTRAAWEMVPRARHQWMEAAWRCASMRWSTLRGVVQVGWDGCSTRSRLCRALVGWPWPRKPPVSTSRSRGSSRRSRAVCWMSASSLRLWAARRSSMDCATTWLHRILSSKGAAEGTVGVGRPLEGGGCLQLWRRTRLFTPMW
jgi:hypothetical protein